MAFELARIHLFDRNMEPVPEIGPSELISAVMSEEINGEHELVITTPRRLEEGWRALTVDATGKWREWVVTETPQEHSSGAHAIGTYRFVWSLQYDLTNAYFHDTGEAVSIGMGTDTSAAVAAEHVVDAAVGWTVGNCDAPDIEAGTGCVFIRESSWSKLSKLVECTGFEVDSDIEVDRVHAGIRGSDQYRVTSRDIILTSHVGSETATRRFDWGYDIANIKRTPDPGPYYCRVVPLGKGEQEYADDDETTFDYPIDITEEVDEHGNPYPYYLQDDEAAAVFRIKSSYDGSWIYPTIAVSYSEDDPELLLKAAQEDLHKYTRPNVTYEADVLQFSQAGMDVRGVALGDEVQIVDHGFNPDAALRLQGRVTKIETDLLSPETGTTLTIGNLRDNMADAIAEANSELDALVSQNADIRKSLAGMNTTRYVQELLERINTEIAATGGYTYLVEGEGLITYDKAVVDPLSNLATDGTYATRVIQLKGGYLRIAEDANAGRMGIDDWNFTTLLEAGHIVSDLITVVKITSGYIGNATNSNYWNLDSGELVLRKKWLTNEGLETKHGLYTINSAVRYLLWGGYDGQYSTSTSFLALSTDDVQYGATEDTVIGNIILAPLTTASSVNYISGARFWNSIASAGNIHIVSNYEQSTFSASALHEDYAALYVAEPVSGTQSGAMSLANSVAYAGQNVLASICVDDDGIRAKVKAPSGSSSAIASSGRRIELTTNDGLHLYYTPISFSGSSITSTNLSTSLFSGSSSGARIGPRLYVSDSDTDDSGYDQKPGNGSIIAKNLYIGSTGQTNTNSGTVVIRGSLSLNGSYIGTGSKSRSVETDDYDDRLLFCYETSTPMFGDIGSGLIGEDGICYVQIDDIFSETANTSASYQVFLQKCGRGDLWVSEKHLGYFVVEGTPGLAFDWELKARQFGYESMRLEDTDSYMSFERGTSDSVDESRGVMRLYGDVGTESSLVADSTESVYDDYISDIEHLYDDDLAA